LLPSTKVNQRVRLQLEGMEGQWSQFNVDVLSAPLFQHVMYPQQHAETVDKAIMLQPSSIEGLDFTAHDPDQMSRPACTVKEACVDGNTKDESQPKIGDCKTSLKEFLKTYGHPKDNLVLCKSDGMPVTTLMIRNVPQELSLDDLKLEFEEAGFGNHYNCLYMPLQKHKGQNRGFAYVNLTSPIFASRFKSTFHKQIFRNANKQKPLLLSATCVQGFTESLRLARERGLGHVQSGLYVPQICLQ